MQSNFTISRNCIKKAKLFEECSNCTEKRNVKYFQYFRNDKWRISCVFQIFSKVVILGNVRFIRIKEVFEIIQRIRLFGFGGGGGDYSKPLQWIVGKIENIDLFDSR